MLGSRLKELRNKKKLTQKQLAEKINVTHVSISGYESGNRSPDTDTLQRLADFFEVSTDYLLGRTNPKNSSGDYEIKTIAAHREGDGDWTEEELEEIERFKEFVRMKRGGK